MTEPTHWPLEPHTLAKHRVLRGFLDAWIPIMAQQTLGLPHVHDKRLLLIDGFAGPGSYAGGEPGSPLLMLHAVLDHDALPRLTGVEFEFLFIEQEPDRASALRERIAELGDLPECVTATVHTASYQDSVEVMATAQSPVPGAPPVPTFLFVDPFGYSKSPMELTGRMLRHPRCEMLSFLPLTHICRFLSRPGQELALDGLFGVDLWRAGKELHGDERADYLLELYENQIALQAGVKHVRSVRLKTRDRQDYRLVFAVGHTKGLRVAKSAMWRIAPADGETFVAEAAGQEVLFDRDAEVDTGPLLSLLREEFQTRWFTLEEAEERADQSPYRAEGHLVNLTLRPAEKDGTLEVRRTRKGFKGAHMRFRG